MKAVIIVVLYKETVSSSQTINSLLVNCIDLIRDTLIVIWDNSPLSMSKNDLAILNNYNLQYKYYHTPENLALSKIYNRVIASHHENNELLFLFDQDSYITADYFIMIKEAVYNNLDINFFAPYVMVNNTIVSPGNFGFYTGRYWKNKMTGKLIAKNVIAIASGMAIRFDCFTNQNLKFDEKLSLYGIDTKFCLDYFLKNEYLYIIDYQLSHNLSAFEVESNTIKLNRMRSHGKSLRYILRRKHLIGFLIFSVIYVIKLLRLRILICMEK